MLPFDAVLTGALVVALDLALSTWPASGACQGGVSSHHGDWAAHLGDPDTRTGGGCNGSPPGPGIRRGGKWSGDRGLGDDSGPLTVTHFAVRVDDAICLLRGEILEVGALV